MENTEFLAIRTAAIVVAASCGLGCGPHNKAYVGPQRQPKDIGIVEPASEPGFQHTYVAILQINDQNKIAEWRGGSDVPAELLPGEYRFRVEYRQFTTATGLLFVDIATVVNDATTNAEHQAATITFPVWSGQTHYIYYDVKRHTFFVRRGTATATGQPPPPLAPPTDAIQCVPSPDRSADFWCELAPTKPAT